MYNTIFALCSFGGNVDSSVHNGSGPCVFRVCDLTYHSIGSLLPPDGRTPKFAQFYMLGSLALVTMPMIYFWPRVIMIEEVAEAPRLAAQGRNSRIRKLLFWINGCSVQATHPPGRASN